MRKDPTEFRKRFQSWKLGIPAYEDGKPIDYTKVAQESRDREYNTAMSYFKSTPNILNLANGIYHFAKSTPLFGDTPASVNPNMIYGDAPAVGYRNATNLAETTRRIKAAVKPFVNGVSNTKLSTQALQQEIRYGDTYYPEQLTIAERNAMAKLRQSKLAEEKSKYVMVDNAPKVGLKNYILMENGRPLAEMIASMEDESIIPEMVYKTNKTAHHTTTDLYSGILKYLKQAGNKGGVVSGKDYKSTQATLKQVKNFKKEKISDGGIWDNEGLVGYDQEPTLVKTMKEADELNKKGKAFILYNQPIYRLLQPVKDIPIKDRYMFDPRRIGPNGEYNIDMSNPSRFAQNQDDSNQRHYFRGGKDLPKFRGGSDGTRYVPTDDGWGRITDSDVANLMENFVATPYGVRNKFDYEYNPNYKQPVGKNAVVRQDNNAWTRQRVAEESNKRSWLSDAADVSHAIGEGAMLASTFAAPEVEPLVYPAYLATKNAVLSALTSNTPVMLYVRYPLGKVIYGMDALFPTLYRKIKSMPTEPVNGTIQISNPGNRFVFSNTKKESPIITNFTYDAPVRKHASGNWDPGFTLAMPGRKTLLGKNVISTEPSDLFTYGDDIKIPLSDVTLISGDLDEIALANQYGYKVATSPKLQQLYLEGDSPGIEFMSKGGRKISLRKQDLSAYAKEVENMTRLLFKSPTKNDVDFMNFVLLPKIKGDVYDPSMLDYLVNNGIGPFGDRIGNAELRSYLLDPDRWRNILYDPATHAESQFRDLMGIELRSKFKSGKDIYIKPSHRGRLTALKKRTGKSEAELYRTGSAATRKMITFARNARKWKH